MSRTAYRPRRSVLYMPASNARALEKAKGIPSDALILDLEDAVAPDAKAAARENAVAAVRSGQYGRREVTIRVNAAGTEWFWDDLIAACSAGPDGIVVPKVQSAREVHNAVHAMERHHAPTRTKLWAMVETPAAILTVGKLAAASPRLACLVMGTNDLAKELDAQHVPGREPLVTALSIAVLAARAAGIAIVDGVYNDVRDPEGFEAECHQARALGFDGKTLIHPDQVDICNRVFAPSDEQVQDAQGVIDAFEQVMAEGQGVATYKGRLVENLHVETARRVLEAREAIDALSAG